MKHPSLCLLLSLSLTGPMLASEVLFESDFENSMATTGQPPAIASHEDAKPGRVVSAEVAPAAGASQDSSAALLIAGGEAEQHSWKPAADIRFEPQTTGMMTISFAVRNISLDSGQLGVQVAMQDREANSYEVYQTMTVYPDHIKISGSGRHLFKAITAGNSSLWHKIVWSFPLPKTAGLTPTLQVDGQDQGAFQFTPGEKAQYVNNVRFWLSSKRNQDIQFLIDDVKIEVTP